MAARVSGLIAIAVAVLLGGGVHAQEVLTNDAVIAMVKAGLSESLVVTKIVATTTNFDLRADTLAGLKAAGVPERIIEAMVVHNGRGARPGPPPDRPRP
jgi:hypothetical protein